MKKKLFLFVLMVSMLVCLFAIVANAQEVPEWTEITEVSGMPDRSVFGEDGTVGATSRVLMSDGITYPSYYICKNSNSLGISFTDLNSKTGKSYAAKDVIRIEIPKGVVSTPMSALKTESGYTALVTVLFPEGFTTLGSYTFKATEKVPSSLKYVSLPSTLTTIEQFAFTYCNSLEELIIPEGITTIPNSMANYTTSLKKVVFPSTLVTISESAFRSANLSEGVIIPEGCTTIGSYAFKASLTPSVSLPSTLETLGNDIFRECNSLVEVNSKSPKIAHQMFYDCDEIKTVRLENVKTIADYAFCNPNGGISKIDTLFLDEGLTSIGKYAFTRTSLTTLVLPSTLTTIGEQSFISSATLQTIVVLGPTLGKNMFDKCSNVTKLVLTEKFTTFGSGCLNNVSQNSFTTYYTGTDYDRIKSIGQSITTRIKEASYTSYEDYVSGNYTSKKFMFIYDVNLCVAAFDGVHTEPNDDGDCTSAIICSMCKEHTFKEAMTHNYQERIEYSDFMKEGTFFVDCINEGCNCDTTEKTEALFTCLGYSTPENGRGEIVIGYTVNSEAIARYERVSNSEVKYGIFAVLKDKIGTNEIFGSDGNANDNAICVDVSDNNYYSFELKIYGFIDGYKDIKVAMGAYISVNGKYSYMQKGTPSQGENYVFISYNEINAQ